MSRLEKIVTRLSQRMGLDAKELQTFFAKGKEVTYKAEAWLFHESSPKAWAGLVLEGEVELVQGLHGSSRHLAVLTPGALISEGAILDEQAHSIGAMTRGGVTLWQIDQAAIAAYRTECPEMFCRIVARIAVLISDRLRMASARKAQESGPNVVGRMRLERDSLGERELPEHAYYGVQTLRAMENFAISGTFVKDFDQESRRHGQPGTGRDHAGPGPSHLRHLRRIALRQTARSIRRGHVPGRSRNVDQHVCQRGHRQPRLGIDGPQEG